VTWPRSATNALVIFKNVPPGRGVLRLEGTSWRKQSIDVALTPGALSVDGPLVAAAVPSVVLDWSSFAGDDGSGQRCAIVSDTPQIGIDSCSDPARCTAVSRFTAEAAEGSVRIELPGEGLFRWRIALDDETLFDGMLSAKNGVEEVVDVAAHGVPVYGMVTRGGVPAPGVVRFATGAAVAGASGHFVAILSAEPGANLISVDDCAGETVYRHIPEVAVTAGSHVTIDIPESTLVIRARDGRGRPVEGARVWYAVVKDAERGSAFYTSGQQTSDGTGRAEFRHAPPGRPLVACGSSEEHLPSCGEPFELTGEGREIEIDLEQNGTFRGRIASDRPFIDATLFLVAHSGIVEHRDTLGIDGAFRLPLPEGAESYLVIASASHPLALAALPPGELRNVTLDYPAGRPRLVAVRALGRYSGSERLFTLVSGGRRIPVSALAEHLRLRGSDYWLESEAAVRLDVLEIAPLTVLLGPSFHEVRHLPAAADPFSRPEYMHGIMAAAVGPTGEVVFE
jgi:hypothetical protein